MAPESNKRSTREMRSFAMRRHRFKSTAELRAAGPPPPPTPPPPPPPGPKRFQVVPLSYLAQKPPAKADAPAPRLPDRRHAPAFSNKPNPTAPPTASALPPAAPPPPPPPPPKPEGSTARPSARELDRIAFSGSLNERVTLACGENAELAIAIVAAPGLPESAILKIAQSPATSSPVLAYIASLRRFRYNRTVANALLFNPKTPAHTSLELLPLASPRQLQELARTYDVPDALRQRVRFLLENRGHKKHG